MLSNQLNKENYIACLKKATHYLLAVACSLVLFLCLFYTDHTALAHFVKPEKGDVCPICGMSVSEHPAWVAVIMFSDGKHVKFHGPKCMFTYYLKLEKYSKNYKKKDVATLHVTDFYTLEHIRAEKGYYVIHSAVKGPMGGELIPFKDNASAEKFSQEHGGKILRYKEITPEIINTLGNLVPDDSPVSQ